MRRGVGFLIATLLATVPVLVPSATALAEEAGVDSAYVKVALTTKSGQTLQHPGFRVEVDEQGLFVIEIDGKSHEVGVTILKASETKFEVEAQYGIDGRMLLTETFEVEVGKPLELSKNGNTIKIDIDPRGSEDKSRKDEDQIDPPDEDDPLGGMLSSSPPVVG